MKILFACGGTGGHIFPALAMADILKEHFEDPDIVFVGTAHGMEKELIEERGYPWKEIHVRGLKRKLTLENIRIVRECVHAFDESRRLLNDEKPDAVIGTGGYVCYPVLRTAHRMKIPCAVHESNAIPGLTVKLLKRHVEAIWLGMKPSRSTRRLPHSVWMGTPVRKEFLLKNKCEIRRKMGIGDHEFFVLCTGGSQGADTLNRVMKEVMTSFPDPHVRILHICGKKGIETFSDFSPGARRKVIPFTNDMPQYMSAADMVISRSGALTLTELMASGKAAMLIPSPNVTQNHQYHNARLLSDAGASILTEEKDLTPDKVTECIRKWQRDPTAREKTEKTIRTFFKEDTEEIFLKEVEKLLSNKDTAVIFSLKNV